jgi:hypothetical protein
MGLLDELNALRDNLNICKAGEVLNKLPKDELAVVNSILSEPDGNVNALAKILTKNGHAISSRTLLRHRNRHTPNREGCQCP